MSDATAPAGPGDVSRGRPRGRRRRAGVRRQRPLLPLQGVRPHPLRQQSRSGSAARSAPRPTTAPVTADFCPFQQGNLCTAREPRPLGCRVYYCDPNYQDTGSRISENVSAPAQGPGRRPRRAAGATPRCTTSSIIPKTPSPKPRQPSGRTDGGDFAMLRLRSLLILLLTAAPAARRGLAAVARPQPRRHLAGDDRALEGRPEGPLAEAGRRGPQLAGRRRRQGVPAHQGRRTRKPRTSAPTTPAAASTLWSTAYDRDEFKSPFGIGPRATPAVGRRQGLHASAPRAS